MPTIARRTLDAIRRTSRRAVLAAIATSSFLGVAEAQRPPEQLGAGGILHRMQKLEVVGSVLYIAAHPDDENTRLISYLSNGKKVRTAYLSLTRGDGGQNLIGPELGDALGIIRTQELLEARRIDGGEQFFTRAVDFGYSKSADETFAKWGRREVLGDVVRVVRQFRPDVIITRFATDGSGGHGHHTASALLAHEAFDLAADPAAFPEQIAEGLEPWQAARLFFNASTWWRKDLPEVVAKEPTNWVPIDVGGFDPLLGASYGEIAGRSRSQHKSQGFGAAETRGEQIEYLRFEKGVRLAKSDLFDGLLLDWSRFERSGNLPFRMRTMVRTYDPREPERSLEELTAITRTLDGIAGSSGPERSWARHHAAAARQLMLQVSGVVVEAISSSPRIARGETQSLSLSAIQRRPGRAFTVTDFTAPDGSRIAADKLLAWNIAETQKFDFAVSAEQGIDQPYWLEAPHEALYRPDPNRHTGIEPTAPRAATLMGNLALPGGTSLSIDLATMHKWVDRVDGERSQPVVITPVASIVVADAVAIVPGERASITVEIEALTDDLSGTVSASVPNGWTIERQPEAIENLARGERRSVRVELKRTPESMRGPMRFTFTGAKGSTDRTLHRIDYPHIQPQTWYTPAEVMLIPQHIVTSAKIVGYIDGAGDEIPKALERLGVVVERIDPRKAHASDLVRCDAIVTGIRAYNTVPELAHFQSTLLDYVALGGTLVVQYNTNGNDLVLDAKKLGPYPFALTRQRVTVEEASATILAPSHPLMNVPNRLEATDFDGWVQERGLYFAGDLDAQYTALIAWNDPGEAPLSGGLIACDHGKGRFVYTGISLFRQLPAGVPGSYRILANLISRRAGGE